MLEPELSKLYGSETLDFGGMFVNGAISPDGRWLAYSRAEPGQDAMNLWIVSLEGASDPIRLTSGNHWEAGPVWFPNGERIAFRSSRVDSGNRFQYVMTLEIDPGTGHPAGSARQVSLESVPFTTAYDVSPDGQWIVYVRRPEHFPSRATTPDEHEADLFVLKVIPASGGTARRIAEQPEGMWNIVWSTDRHIYYTSWLAAGDQAAVEKGFSTKRVPSEGGEVQTLATWTETYWATLCPEARYLYFESSPPGSEEEVLTVATIGGRNLGKFSLPGTMDPFGCTATGPAILATTQETAAPLMVVPIGGGPPRQLTETRAYEWPMGWTPDSRAIVLASQLDGHNVLLVAPLDGSAMQQLATSDEEDVFGASLSRDNRHVFYGVGKGANRTPVLKILDLTSRSSRVISRSPWVEYNRYNSSRDGDHFLYADQKDGRFEFRSVHPEGDPVLLRSFPDSLFPPIIGVHGERVAYWVASGDESILHLATAGQPEAREIVRYPGRVGQRGSNPPVWSPDGRYLVTGYANPGAGGLDALLVELTDDGTLVGQPGIVTGLPETWWNLDWLPGGDGFLLVDGDVWLVSLEPGSQPVNLTDEGIGTTWSYSLSPDGRYIAVSPEVRRGGAFWRLDFSDALQATRR